MPPRPGLLGILRYPSLFTNPKEARNRIRKHQYGDRGFTCAIILVCLLGLLGFALDQKLFITMRQPW